MVYYKVSALGVKIDVLLSILLELRVILKEECNIFDVI